MCNVMVCCCDSASGGKLVDGTPQLERDLKDDMDKVDRMYSATGPDFLKFPTFKFEGLKFSLLSPNPKCPHFYQCSLCTRL